MNQSRRPQGFLHKDNFWLGIVIGLCVPIMAYGIILTGFDFVDENFLPPDVSMSRGFRERTLSVIAICCNLIPFHFYNRRYATNTMRGMVAPTLTFVGLWIWFFGRHLIGIS